MITFKTSLPCKPVRQGTEFNWLTVEDSRDAAHVFADRYARREFGKTGYCHHVRLDLWREDGRWHQYEAFIGKPDRYSGGCTGRNVIFTVTTEGEWENA